MLTQAQVEAFERDGFVGPFRAFDEAEMASIGEMIERLLLTSDGPDPTSRVQSRHLDSPEVLALCTAPEIVERVAAVLGPDLVLWRSNFFHKTPGAAELEWHRDWPHWGSILKPMINISVWLAIDPATRANGCVRLIPGSHMRSYVARGEDNKFVDVPPEERETALPMALSAGEFFMFNKDVVHASSENTSQLRRLGLAMRYTLPSVTIDHAGIFPGHRSIAVRTAQTTSPTT